MVLHLAQLNWAEALPASLEPFNLSKHLRIVFLLALLDFLVRFSYNLDHRRRSGFDRGFSFFFSQVLYQIGRNFVAVIAKRTLEVADPFLEPCVFPDQVVEPGLLGVQRVADDLVSLLQLQNKFKFFFVRQLIELFLAHWLGQVELGRILLAIKLFDIKSK